MFKIGQCLETMNINENIRCDNYINSINETLENTCRQYVLKRVHCLHKHVSETTSLIRFPVSLTPMAWNTCE